MHLWIDRVAWRLIRQDALERGISASEWLRQCIEERFNLMGLLNAPMLKSLDERSRRITG